MYVLAVLTLLFMVVITIGVAVYAINHRALSDLWFVAIFSLIIIGLAIRPNRFPFKTVLDGDTLTTYGIQGRRGIQLSALAKVKEVMLVAYTYDNICSLRLTDTSGKTVFIHLAGVSEANRELLYEPLLKALQNPQITGDKLEVCTDTWDKWYRFRSNRKTTA